MATKKQLASTSSKTVPVVEAAAKALRFARSMAPKNVGVKQSADTPAPLLRKNLKANGRKMLDVALEMVYAEGVKAGRQSVKGAAPVAVDSDAEAIGKALLDPKVTTTKAILMMQMARSKRGLR